MGDVLVSANFDILETTRQRPGEGRKVKKMNALDATFHRHMHAHASTESTDSTSKQQ